MTSKLDNRKKSRSGLRAAAPARVKRAARVATKAKSSTTAPITLTLETECTLAQAGAFKVKLLTLLEYGGPVTIEAGATQRIDAAGLELLAAFIRDREASGRAVSWKEALPVVEQAARRIGLGEWLQLKVSQRS